MTNDVNLGAGAATAAPAPRAPRTRLSLHPWVEFAIKRTFGLVVTFFVALTVTFLAVLLIPGDPATLAAGPDADLDKIASVREAMGLDRPVGERYVEYLGGVITGDLGRSFSISAPVADVIAARLPFTLALAGVSIVVVLLVALPLGVAVAVATRGGRRAWLDSIFSATTGLLMSIPPYVKATLLVLLFAIWLAVLPPAYSRNNVGMSMILPVLALVLGPISSIARVTRRETAVVLAQDYVRTARGWRLPSFDVIMRYVLPNALTSALTLSGIILAGLVGGAVIVETVFNWPGLGLAVVNAIGERDYPLIQGLILFLTMTAAVLILVVDIILGLIDPRTLGSRR